MRPPLLVAICLLGLMLALGNYARMPELRRFLRRTKEIPAPADRVRRWIRVTEAGGGIADELAEEDHELGIPQQP